MTGRLGPGEAYTSRAGLRRGLILAYLGEHPGSSLRALCRECDLSVGTARHHLGMLTRHRLVWRERQVNQDHWFLGQRPSPKRVQDAMRAALPEELGSVLAFVTANAPVYQSEVLEAFPWPKASTQLRLSKLVAQGHLEARRAVRRLYYSRPGGWASWGG